MLRFIARRLFAGLATLFVSTFLMYLLVSVSIRPLDDLIESSAPNKQQLIAQRTELLDLNTPVIVRFFKWLANFVQGDFGTAWRTGQHVNSQLGTAMVSTIQLVLAASVLAIILGVGVGIISALRQYSTFDYIITFTSFLLYSLPAFWVAVLLKQWGAIGFNDFLKDPYLSALGIAGMAVIFGVLWMLAVGGDARRRLINFAGAAGITAALYTYLQVSNWWLEPNINPILLAVLGAGAAVGFTLLSTGLRNRRALGAAGTTVVIGVIAYFPLQYVFYNESFNWWWLLGLAALAAGIGILIGRLWGGPDWRQSSRAAALTAITMGGLTFVDQAMLYWGDYLKMSQIRGRPIATVGDRTPNLGGDFWISTLDTYTHLLLPTVALMLISFAAYTRYSRASMLEVMNQDYIRTARAKGLTERTVVMRHAFRNSLIPLATIVPMDLVAVFGGAIITEQVFGRPGMGQLFVKSLSMAEIDPVMAYLVVTAALAVLANIVADLIYAALDPRIRVNS